MIKDVRKIKNDTYESKVMRQGHNLPTINKVDYTNIDSNTYNELLETFSLHASVDPYFQMEDTIEKLQTLAKICTFSVLKKLYDPQKSNTSARDSVDDSGCNTTIAKMKSGLMYDLSQLDNLIDNINESVHITYNKEGDEVKTWDNVPYVSERIQDGLDLYNTAIIAIIDESRKQYNRDGMVDFTATYQKRVLSKKVYIHDNDSRKWEDRDTTPIQEVYKAIRRYVMNTRHLNVDPTCKYVYLSDIVYDDNSKEEEVVYRRLQKEWQLVDTMEVHGNNKTVTMASVTRQTVTDIETIIEKLNLTKRQRQVLDYRMRGYGARAIGNTLGVSPQAITKTVNQIREKCKKIGFVPANMK